MLHMLLEYLFLFLGNLFHFVASLFNMIIHFKFGCHNMTVLTITVITVSVLIQHDNLYNNQATIFTPPYTLILCDLLAKKQNKQEKCD